MKYLSILRVSTLVCLFLFFSPLMVIGQSNSTISFTVSPSYSYFVIQGEGRPVGTFFQLSTNRNDKPGLGWRFGVNGSQKFTKDDYVEFGFHVVGIKFSTQSQFLSNDLNLNKFLLLEFPILFRHVFETNKYTSYMVAGVTFGSYQSSSTSGVSFRGPFVEDLPSFNLAAVLGVGLEYHFSDNRALFFQPTLRYNLTGIQVGINRMYHFYTLGVDVGLRRYL